MLYHILNHAWLPLSFSLYYSVLDVPISHDFHNNRNKMMELAGLNVLSFKQLMVLSRDDDLTNQFMDIKLERKQQRATRQLLANIFLNTLLKMVP